MADNPSFEIPPQLREMAEKNVEQARAAYGQFMDFLTQAMNTWAKSPAGGGTPGLKAVQDRAVGFAKENAERSFGLASELARAKDVQEVLTSAEPLCANADAVVRGAGAAAQLADGRRNAGLAVERLSARCPRRLSRSACPNRPPRRHAS